jgi:ribosomal protein L17
MRKDLKLIGAAYITKALRAWLRRQETAGNTLVRTRAVRDFINGLNERYNKRLGGLGK